MTAFVSGVTVTMSAKRDLPKGADMSITELNSLPHEDHRRVEAWRNATDDIRRTMIAEAIAAAVEKNEGRKLTPAIERTVKGDASFAARKLVYDLKEVDGLTNPIHDDPIWGPKASTAVEVERPVDAELEALVEWLALQTWSSFAVSLAEQYRTRGSLSTKQIEAAKSMRAKTQARKTETAGKTTEIDLTDLPSGYYAVPGGDTRLKVRVAHGKPGSKWDGFTFVTDGAAYGQRKNYGMQKPGGTYRGEIGEALTSILSNPLEAMKAYGRLVGRCGDCNRILEDEDSIRAGIGPICETKWAA